MEAIKATAPDALTAVLSLRDPRTKDWETLENPTYILLLLGSYLYIAKSLGPRFMKSRDPYELKGVIMAYNLFQVVANVYFLSRMFYHSFWAAGYSPFCQGLYYSTDTHAISLLNTMYWYLWVRVADFLDTIFFVMKKKFSHITVLHVVHHTIVVFSGWMFMQFGSDGQVVFGVCLNSFVHIIMYTYYFLACLGPAVQKYLWWKRYLTRLQIGQFLVIIAHALIPMFVDCGYPRVLLFIAIPQVVLILGLFVNFYVQSYIKRKNADAEKLTKACFPQVVSQSDLLSSDVPNGIHKKTS